MPSRSEENPLDYGTLASYLTALGYPARLELLHLLRSPHHLSDLRLNPHRSRGGKRANTSARETVRHHLDKLAEVDLVRVDHDLEEGRPANRYSVNPQKLYSITEELRRLSTIYHGQGAAADATGTLAQAQSPPLVEGPRLVLVHGVYEGRSYLLDTRSASKGRWIIGRKPGLAVSLDYDPYVSVENSTIHGRAERFHVSDLEGSKNGTSVNWARLPKGESRLLKAGDIIGVGRSLLCFLPE